MTAETRTPLDYSIQARKLIGVIEDSLRGRTLTRIARERVIPESIVDQLLKAHGHPDARSLREADAYLRSLPEGYEVHVDLDAPALADDPPAPLPVREWSPGDSGVLRPVPESAYPPEGTPLPEPQAKEGMRLQTVLLKDLHPDPENARERLEEIEELAASIRQLGRLLQPIVVRPVDGHLVIIAGHRRLAALQLLGWSSTRVLVRTDIRPDDVLAAMMIENTQRSDLDPVEEARALRRIKAQMGDASDSAVAARLGRSALWVGSRLAILALSPEDQERLRAGDMNVTDAIRRGRMASGRVGRRNSTGHPHLGIDHPLERQARARCSRLGHKKRGRNSVGGVACGECWESVIRADEKDGLHAHAALKGKCPICDAPTSLEAPT